MSSIRKVAIFSAIAKYLKKNAKTIICCIVIFIIGVVIGIIAPLLAVDGDFEAISRDEIQFGCAKVFFISMLALFGGYIIILFGCHKLVFISLIPFIILGYFCGEYCTILVARYQGIGIINLVVIYLPFFIFSLAFMTISLISCVSSCCGASIKYSLIALSKLFFINILINFIIFMIIGGITGVVIVKIY